MEARIMAIRMNWPEILVEIWIWVGKGTSQDQQWLEDDAYHAFNHVNDWTLCNLENSDIHVKASTIDECLAKEFHDEHRVKRLQSDARPVISVNLTKFLRGKVGVSSIKIRHDIENRELDFVSINIKLLGWLSLHFAMNCS